MIIVSITAWISGAEEGSQFRGTRKFLMVEIESYGGFLK